MFAISNQTNEMLSYCINFNIVKLPVEQTCLCYQIVKISDKSELMWKIIAKLGYVEAYLFQLDLY